jgi:adhesin transport system membrane fusion protein
MNSGKLKDLARWLRDDLRERIRARLAVHEEDIPFMSDTNTAVLMGARRSSHLILWGTVLFLFVALIWAANATLDEVTHGQGKVIPSSKLQIVQNLEGGILTELFVKEGDMVDKDQPLLQLDDTRFSSNYRETRTKYLALTARKARLTAEIEERPYEAPAEVVQEYPQLATNEQDLYRSRQSELASNIVVLNQQETQTQQQLAEARSRVAQLERSYALLSQELNMSAPLAKEGAISEVEVLRLRRSVNDMRGERDATRLSIPRMEAALDEVRGKIDEVRIAFRTKAQSELNDTQAELSGLTETITSLQDRVSRTTVRSPLRGTVKQIKVNTIGGIVQPGMDLVEVVPTEGSLLVEAHIRPSDIAFLRPNQKAMVKLTAYDYSIYGGLPAKLEHISADTDTNDKDESFYVIRVRTDSDHLIKNGEQLKIIPGMTATVDVLTGHKTVLDYLLKPVLKARERALRER